MSSIRFLFVFLFFCLSLGTTFASFSADDFIAQFQTKQSTLSLAEKKTYYLQVYNNLSLLAVRNRSDAEQIKLYTSLREYVSTQIKNLGSSASYLTSLSFSGMNISKVDLTKVRDVWLALHNIERSTKSLTSFTYSSALEGTASTWANHLAELGRTSHQRKNTDGYYSYNSIKTWFLDQGIVFATEEKNGQSLFTENLGRGYYTCKKADCTEDFIKAIKTSRAFFIKEKGKSYRPHYNAIMGDFSIIGLGVALVGSKYYLVSHYTQDLK